MVNILKYGCFVVGMDNYTDTTVYRVCTFASTPVVHCEDIDNQTYIYGFHVDMFRDIANTLAMLYNMSCLPYQDFRAEIELGYDKPIGSNETNCDVFIGNYDATTTLQKNYILTTPTIWTGVNLLTTKNYNKAYTILGFLNAFTWDLWLMIIMFCLIFALIVMAVNYLSQWHYSPVSSQPKSKFLQIVFDISESWLFNITHLASIDGNVTYGNGQCLSKVLAVSFGFFSVMILSYFTAVTTTQLTTTHFEYSIPTYNDLRSPLVKIGAPLKYVPTLKAQFNIQNIIPYNYNNDKDLQIMINDLMSGKIQGLAIDTIAAKYYSSVYCVLEYLPQSLFISYQPFYFKKHTNTFTVDRVSETLLQIQQSSYYVKYVTQYIEVGLNDTCSTADLPTTLGLSDLAGLFIVCGSIGVFCILVVLGRSAISWIKIRKNFDGESVNLPRTLHDAEQPRRLEVCDSRPFDIASERRSFDIPSERRSFDIPNERKSFDIPSSSSMKRNMSDNHK
jgi:ABC-type amino acid transport substrate-binding protein